MTLRDGPPAWARFISRLSRILVNWWVWTARPFMLHPIRSIKQLFEREPVSEDDLAALTPEERKALK